LSQTDIIWAFLVAGLLGFLIGLERERKREMVGSIFAGVRTFPLIALFGAITGLLSREAGTAIIVVGFAAMAVLAGLAYWRETAGEKVGGTTEVAAFVTFGLGVLAGLDYFAAALAGAVIATGILSLRQELRRFTRALTDQDLFATVQFAAVSLVILPLVPDAALGPWGVWNPRTIWLLVVLISGISFVGYVAVKLVGPRRGIGLSGLLGGLASSTAVTMSFSQRSRTAQAMATTLAVGALGATAVSAPRLAVLLAVVAPQLVMPAAVPLGTLFLATSLAALLLARRHVPDDAAPDVTNPFELRTALQFALLFAGVLLLTRAAEEYLGVGGLYLASALSGVAQLDAITLSLGRQVQEALAVEVAVKGLALAVAANCVFKGGLAMAVGGPRFGRIVLATLLGVAALVVLATWLVPALL
jgi:uncharacterized membrane protein (DUF4010 family)